MSGAPGRSGRHKPAVLAAEATRRDATGGNPEAPRPKRSLAKADCPAWFDDDHRAEWDALIDIAPRGLLKITDLAVVTEYVFQRVAHRKVSEALMKEGPTIDDRGVQRMNPRFRAHKAIGERLMWVCRELGFTPSARQHVKIPIGDQVPVMPTEAANDFEGL